MRHYATGYGVKPSEMFIKYKSEKLGLTKKDLENLGSGLRPRDFAASVFVYAYSLILNDVIDNKVVFSLPTRRESYIEMEKLDKDQFMQARQAGAFKEIDIMRAGFTASKLVFRFKKKAGWGIKPIAVHKKLKNKIIANTNNKMY